MEDGTQVHVDALSDRSVWGGDSTNHFILQLRGLQPNRDRHHLHSCPLPSHPRSVPAAYARQREKQGSRTCFLPRLLSPRCQIERKPVLPPHAARWHHSISIIIIKASTLSSVGVDPPTSGSRRCGNGGLRRRPAFKMAWLH